MLSLGSHVDAPIAMTTGDVLVAKGSDTVPCTGGDIEVSIRNQMTPCDGCEKLQEELQQRQRDHTFYTALKKKISLTDSLIKKYNSKCQEFDQQQKNLEDVAFKLASTKRDYKVLEEQLTATLKEVIPWKRDKNKFLKELDECRAQLRDTKDKLEGSEASCVQFKEGFQEMQGELESLEGKHSDLKRAAEKTQQGEKKTSALLAKNKEDLMTCKKELKNVKKREVKLAGQHQRAKDKISELVELLEDNGIPVPRIHKSLLGGTVTSQEGISTEDTDFGQVDEASSPPEGIMRGTSASTAETDGKEPNGSQPSVDKDACLQILDQFSWGLSSCVSPLPPTPPPLSPGSGVEVLSDESSDASRDDGSNNESFSDVADQIESQLNLFQEKGCAEDASPHAKEKMEPEKRQLRQTPQRKAKARRASRTTDNALRDDSEDETSEKQRLARRRQRPSLKSGETGIPSGSRRLEGAGELTSDMNNDLKDHPHSSTNESGDSPLQLKHTRNKSSKGKKLKMDGECNGSATEVSGRDSADSEKYQERRFNARPSGLSSTLSEDSDDSQSSNKDAKNRPTEAQENGNSLLTAESKTSLNVQGKHLTPVELDLKKSHEDALAKQQKLLLSPDRRMTRSQLKTLTEQGVTDLTNITVPDETLHSGKTKRRSQSEKADLHEESSNCKADENQSRLKDANATKSPLEQFAQDKKDSQRRPVTRSLFLSDNDTEAAPSLTTRVSSKRFLRSNSATEDKLITEDPDVSYESTSDKVHQELSASKAEAPSSPSVLSPRKRLRSATLSENSLGSDAERDRTSDPVSRPAVKGRPENISERLSKSVSVPWVKSSRPNCDSDRPGDVSDPVTRRVTRSQVHALGNSNEDKIITRGMIRSAAQNSTLKTDTEILPPKGNDPTSRPCHKSNKDVRPVSGGEDKVVQMSDGAKTSSENQESSIRGTIPADTLAEVKKSQPESDLSDIQGSKSVHEGSPAANCNDGDDTGTHKDEVAPSRRVTRSLSFSDGKPKSPTRDFSVSCGMTTPDTNGVTTGEQDVTEAHDMVSGSHADIEKEFIASKEGERESEPEVSLQNSTSDPSTEDQTTPGHCVEEPLPTEATTRPEFDNSGKAHDDSQQGMSLTAQPTEENQEGGTGDLSSGETNLPATECPNPGVCEDIAIMSSDGQGGGNGTGVGKANPCHLNLGEGTSSSGNDPGDKDAVCEEIPEHRAAGPDEHPSVTAAEEARDAVLAQFWAVPSAENLPAEPLTPFQGTSASINKVSNQVLCMEAESSRASTPTTDEVISINSMSGHVSPVSPLTVQRYNTAGPLSPLSSPPRSPPVSPLSVSPLVFDPIVSIPRMLSPLPPSPGIPDSESLDEIGQPASVEGVPGPHLVDQPRMISPLFPTPVPPALSPLPEAPMPNVLSPLHDLSPLRPGYLPTLERSPMISPLRNPLIPSPCNFHAEAPSDALSVRPQHYPPTRRQSASRCLAASFTTTAAGMSQNPEIISPRLHSLASEMVFEFGESNPCTSGLRMLQGPAKDASSSSTQDTKTGDQADHKENPEDLEAQGESSRKRGFLKLDNKATGSKHSKESLVERQLETAKLPEFTEENTVNKNMDPSKDESSNRPSQDLFVEKTYNPPKTRHRNKKTSSKEDELNKSCRSKNSQKKEGKTSIVPEENVSVPGKDVEKATARRCTRSQVGSSRLPQLDCDNPGTKTETSSRHCRKNKEADDSRKLSKTSHKRKKSSDCSDREKSAIDDISTGNQQTDALSVINTSEGERSGDGGPHPRVTSSECKKPGKALLIPALELKTKGFKKSGSLKKRQERMQEAESEVEVIPDDEESGHSAANDGTTAGLSKTETDSLLISGKTIVMEEVISEGGKVDNQDEAQLHQDERSSCGTFLEKGSPKDSRVNASQAPSSLKGTLHEKIDHVALEQPMLRSHSTVGSQKEVASFEMIPQDPCTKMEGKAASKASKATSKIGSIWGNIASQKDPGFVIFNRGLTTKRKHAKEDRDLSQPARVSKKHPQESGKTGEPIGQAHSQTQVGGEADVVSASSESVSSLLGHPKQASQIHSADSKPSLSQEPTDSGSQRDVSQAEIPASRFPSAHVANQDSRGHGTTKTIVSKSGQRSEESSREASTATDPGGSLGPRMIAEGSVTSPGPGDGQTTGDSCQVPFAEEQGAVDFAKHGVNPGSRKRHTSRESNRACNTDECPTPSKQPKKSPVQLSVERGSKVKPLAQKPEGPVLSDLLRRIKELRSKMNAKPLFAAILSFLGQQSISLMLAIKAKCFAKNTSARPLLLPHEEELITCIVDSGLAAKKSSVGMLLSCLCRAVQNPPQSASAKPAVVIAAAYCRVISALSRQIGLIDRVRVFCYDLLREGFPNVEELLLNVAVTWPTVLMNKEGTTSPIRSAIEVVTMQRLVLAACPQNLQAQELIQCFGVICGWRIPEGSEPALQCQRLVASIQDTEVTKLCHSGTPARTLAPRAYETIKALELLACHQGWQWTNNQLVRNQLWPVLKAWSQAILAANSAAPAAAAGRTGSKRRKPAGTGSGVCVESPADASACAVMKLIGCVASMGLDSCKESVFELLKMLAAVLQQPSTSVPWTVQIFTAEAILCLSPSNPTFALDVMQRWQHGSPGVLPDGVEAKTRVLSKIASAMQNTEK